MKRFEGMNIMRGSMLLAWILPLVACAAMQHGKPAAAEDAHTQHQQPVQAAAAPAAHAGHGATPPAADVPTSSAEIARTRPAATLEPDDFDAPAPVSVEEARKAAGGGSGAHEGHGAAGGASEQTLYTCPMHPEVTSATPGTCPKCGMTLVKKEK